MVAGGAYVAAPPAFDPRDTRKWLCEFGDAVKRMMAFGLTAKSSGLIG